MKNSHKLRKIKLSDKFSFPRIAKMKMYFLFYVHNFLVEKSFFITQTDLIWFICSYEKKRRRKKSKMNYLSAIMRIHRWHAWIWIWIWLLMVWHYCAVCTKITLLFYLYMFVAFVLWRGRMWNQPKIKTNKIKCWNDTITLNETE